MSLVITIACPTCGVAANVRCVNKRGVTASATAFFHQARKRLFYKMFIEELRHG